MKKPYDAKPRQLIKVAYGLKSSQYDCGFELAVSDLQVMDMDAPSILPAGSMYRHTPMPDTDPDYFFARETLVFRDPIHFIYRATER